MHSSRIRPARLLPVSSWSGGVPGPGGKPGLGGVPGRGVPGLGGIKTWYWGEEVGVPGL